MSKICCFSGSRDLSGLNIQELTQSLNNILEDLIENGGFTDFRTGGARGFDTLAALCVLKMKRKYPHIKLHLFLPCKNHDRFFSSQEREYYMTTLKYADSCTYIQEEYSNDAMFKRNCALVDGSDICIALLRKPSGGTYQTVRYAKKQKVEVKNILIP